MNREEPTVIFKREAYAGVMQDKITPGRYSAASGQPWSDRGVAFQEETAGAPPAFKRPKHHGSQKRQVIPVTGCVPRFIFDHLERMRDQGGKEKLSRSKVVANIVMRGVQHDVDMQYGATLEPVIEAAVSRSTKRTTNLSLQAYYSAEQARILNIHILRFLMGDTIDELPLIITEAQKQAWVNMKRHVGEDGAPDVLEEQETEGVPWPS